MAGQTPVGRVKRTVTNFVTFQSLRADRKSPCDVIFDFARPIADFRPPRSITTTTATVLHYPRYARDRKMENRMNRMAGREQKTRERKRKRMKRRNREQTKRNENKPKRNQIEKN